MKRRETHGGWEDRLSGMMPDPERLSAVSRSTLVRAGSRWLSFARGLSRGRGRTTAANTRAFIDSLYGGRFKAIEGSAFSLDKVYRTAGGGHFVSETRLSVSVHPRLDLRLLHVAGDRVGSQVFRESHTTTLRSHTGVSDRAQQRGGVAHSLTVQTWSVLAAGVERVAPAFGYVNVYGQRSRQGQGIESARPAVRVERVSREGRATLTSVESSRPTVAPAPASLRLTSLDLRQFVSQTPRQEFVSLLLNTYLPAAVSREAFKVLNTRTAGALWSLSAREAGAQGATERRFEPAHDIPGRQPAAWTYAGPAARHTPGGTVEIRREFRSAETVREYAPLLQLLRTHTASSSMRERSVAARAPRLSEQTPRLQTRDMRDMLSSFHTFVEHLHSNVANTTHIGDATFITRADFVTTLRHGFEQAPARQRGTSSEAAASHATSFNLFGRAVELVRHTSVAETAREASRLEVSRREALIREALTREASTHEVSTREAAAHEAAAHEAGARLMPDRARGGFSTQGAPGAGTFLFAKALLLRRSEGGPSGLRTATAAETARAQRETRAARPEGMALELVRHRREEVLQLPQPGYVFAQPARSQLEERQVITKASREEIVEVVRKEVRTLAASAPAMPAPSRAELAGIADEVYSTLVRRLLVEKERLGRF